MVWKVATLSVKHKQVQVKQQHSVFQSLKRSISRNPAVQALVIAPTRELAIQVSEEIYRIGADKRARILSVYGGQEIGRQIRALRNNPQIIVGTPGRILDHIKRKTLKLDGVQTLVLDEADEMLNMGFIEDINTILASVPC